MSWLSICFIVSSATPTVMRSDVPPKGNWLMSQNANTSNGVTAMTARNYDPGSVMRLSTFAR